MPAGYVFIHPLLTPDDSCAGYLVESIRHPGKEAKIDQDLSQTTASLVQHPQFSRFDKRHPWFVPADDAAANCPTPLIPCFTAEHLATDTGKAQEAELRKAKRKLALILSPNEKLPAPGVWDYVFVAPALARTLPPFALHGLASRSTVVALGVQNHNDHDWAQRNAYALLTGEFLLTRSSPGQKADTSRQKMLHLLALLAEDAETDALNEIFRQEPKLSYSLLRLVNSAAIAPRTPITSFTQAINLLGRRPLERWLQLLIYADPDDGQHPNPLLYKAAVRGRLMELLVHQLDPQPDLPNLSDSVFMIGGFSLLDVLLSMPMAEILLQLPIAPAALAALATHAGPAGQLLLALAMADSRNLASAERLLAELGIDPQAFLLAQIDALSWASRIRQAA